MKLFQQQQLILQIAIVVVVALLSSNDSNLFVAAQEFDRQADNNIEERNVTDVDIVDAAVVNDTESPTGSPTGSPITGTLSPSPTASPTTTTDAPTDFYYGEDVPFRAFVENTSRDISSSAGINGLFLTLGASINNSTGDNNGDDNSKCSTGIYTDDNMMMHNIMHTIEPVYYNETTNTKPSITVSSYPEGLIESIIFGEDIESGTKFLRLKYNERMLLLVGVDLSSTDDDYEVNNDDYYGIWIQFPFDELNEIHLGGDIQVEVKDGFTNMTLLRATDRVHVDMSMSYNKNNTFNVRSSQNSNIVLDVGHSDDDVDESGGSENKKVKAIASDSSIMMISGTVEMIECFNNATCVVDGRIISKYCNDSLVAINATLETDDCSCVTVITTDPPININILTNTTTNDTSISAAYRAPPLFDFGASCVDTTYIPPIVAETNGPTTMNTIFSACPRPVSASVPIVVPVIPDEEELDTANNDTTTTNEDENEEEEGSPTLSTGGSTVPTGSYLDDQNIAIVWENNDSSSSSISMTIMTIATTIISAATMIIAIF